MIISLLRIINSLVNNYWGNYRLDGQTLKRVTYML